MSYIYHPKKKPTATASAQSGKQSTLIAHAIHSNEIVSFIFLLSHRSWAGNTRSENLSLKVTSSPDNLSHTFFSIWLSSNNFGGRDYCVHSNEHKISRAKFLIRMLGVYRRLKIRKQSIMYAIG